jgi:hypothetical protein
LDFKPTCSCGAKMEPANGCDKGQSEYSKYICLKCGRKTEVKNRRKHVEEDLKLQKELNENCPNGKCDL